MASTDGKYVKVKLNPGFDRRSTALGAEGSWYDGDKVRFRTGTPENMRGFEKAATQPFLGEARAAKHWPNIDGTKQCALGTNERLYIFANASCFDITPVHISASVSGAFSTVAGSNQIVIFVSTHSVTPSTGVVVTFNSVTVGGNIFLAGDYVITSIVDDNSFTVSAPTTAVATSTQAGHAHFDVLLAAGPANTTGGFGWGVDVWGHRAGWGAAASTTNITLPLRTWSLDNWGQDLVAVPRDGALYFWDASIGVSSRAYHVDGTPSRFTDMIVSPEDRHLIAVGTTDHFTSLFDPLLVRWCDTEQLQVWNPAVTNAAGGIRIQGGTLLVGSERSHNQIVLWTDDTAHAMAFIGPPFTFGFRQLGTHCGLAGPNAMTDFGGNLYWMSKHNFHFYDGMVRVMDCPVYSKVFDDINLNQSDKIYCGTNEEFSEVLWLYPSGNAAEPNRYVIHKTNENIWYFGTCFWSAWAEQGSFGSILTFGTDHFVRDHEPLGIYTSDGGNMSAYIESGDFDIGDGDQVAFVDRFVPDFDFPSGMGRIDVTFYAKPYPGSQYTSKGPFGVGADTAKVDFRIRGRQFKIRYANPSQGGVGQWRAGSSRLNVQPDGAR